MTLMAAIELAGALRDTSGTYNPLGGARYFSAYWQHMYHGRSVADDAVAVYRLLRHGIAHVFLPRGDLGAVRGPSAAVLLLDAEGRRCVNCDA
jgi:hypothetical protein